MRKFLTVILLLLIAVPVGYANTSSGLISMKFDLSDHGNDKTAQLWIPYPITNANQDISNISVKGTMSSSGVYTDRTHEIPMLYARWENGIKKRTLTFSFNVTRKEFIHRDFPTKESNWDPADYTKYLSATRLGPTDGEVKKLSDSITLGQKTVLGKAKAIYDWTCENTYRNPNTRGCGSGDVCSLIKDPGGKCTDISSVFVSLARAAGVPAREILGIRQGKKPLQDISKWQHCWAEFYLPGYGWVPVDPADVRKMMLKEKLELSDKKTQTYRDYFWGGLDPYRIKLGQGKDIVLNPRQHGEPINYLMYPYAQIGKKTVDWLDPENFKYTITYQQ
ncbi:MAG: transglutaminase domain-containing protein [Desulfobacteraceae bacterium]|nr:transglutaminase domain-containing protein [Desulfobacteraceae bacterium]